MHEKKGDLLRTDEKRYDEIPTRVSVELNRGNHMRATAFSNDVTVRIFTVVICIVVVTGFFIRPLWEDEIEHLHAAYLVHQGQVPYRDFFQNHPPTLHLLLAPIVSLFPQGISAVVLSRTFVMLLLLVSVAVLSTLIPPSFHVPALIVAFSIPGYWLLYHLRPDPFMILCLSIHLFLLKKYLEFPSIYNSFSSGIALGAAVIFLPKIALLVPVVPAFLFFSSDRLRQRTAPIISYLAGLSLIPGIVFGYLVYHRIVHLFFQNVFFINAEFIHWEDIAAKVKTLGADFPLVIFWIIGSYYIFKHSRFPDRFMQIVWVYSVLAMINFLMTPFGWQYNLAAWLVCVVLNVKPFWEAFTAAFGFFQSAWGRRIVLLSFIVPPVCVFCNDVLHVGASYRRVDQFEFVADSVPSGASVFCIAPFHPIFATDSARIYHPWQFHFAENQPAVRKQWFNGLIDSMQNRLPILIDAGYLSAAIEISVDCNAAKKSIVPFLLRNKYREVIHNKRRYFIRKQPD